MKLIITDHKLKLTKDNIGNNSAFGYITQTIKNAFIQTVYPDQEQETIKQIARYEGIADFTKTDLSSEFHQQKKIVYINEYLERLRLKEEQESYFRDVPSKIYKSKIELVENNLLGHEVVKIEKKYQNKKQPVVVELQEVNLLD